MCTIWNETLYTLYGSSICDYIFRIRSQTRRSGAEAVLEMVPRFGQVVLTSARDPDLDFEAKEEWCLQTSDGENVV